ncbi:MAG: hypothetical protein WD396_05210 [Pseudohongiellaceae bacterium]
MIEKSAKFATYSRPLCWIVAVISLLVALLTFSGGAENGSLRGLLWLGVAVVFAASAILLGRNRPAATPENAAAVPPSAAPAGDPGVNAAETDGEQASEQANEREGEREGENDRRE